MVVVGSVGCNGQGVRRAGRTGERKNAGRWGKNAVPVRGPSVGPVGMSGSLVVVV